MNEMPIKPGTICLPQLQLDVSAGKSLRNSLCFGQQTHLVEYDHFCSDLCKNEKNVTKKKNKLAALSGLSFHLNAEDVCRIMMMSVTSSSFLIEA